MTSISKSELWKPFLENQLEGFHTNIIHNLLKVLDDYNFNDTTLTDEVFGNYFNEYLNTSNRYQRDKEEVSSPTLVNEGLAKWTKISEGDVVLDPFAGFCGSLIKISKNNIRTKHSLIAYDIQLEAVVLGMMNFISNDIKNWTYKLKDTLNTQAEIFKDDIDDGIADWICTIPPFTPSINQGKNRNIKSISSSEKSPSPNYYINAILRMLNPKGKAIITIPDGFLFSSDETTKGIRRFLIEENILKTVIALPQNSFQPFSSVNTSILILEKQSRSYNDTHFIYLQKWSQGKLISGVDEVLDIIINHKEIEGKAIIVPINVIRNNHYFLNANRYFSDKEKLTDGYLSLRELIKNHFSNPLIKNEELISSGTIPFISVSNLSTSIDNSVLDKNKIKSFISSDLVNDKKLKFIKPGSILCSKIGQNLRPTLVANATGLISGGNVLVLEVDSSIIIPEYLINQLYKEYVDKQLGAIVIGSAQTFIRLEDLLEIKIKVPSLKEQSFILNNYGYNSMPNLVQEAESEYQVIKHIKHSYSQLNDAIGSDIINIKSYLEEKEKSKEFVSFEDRVSERKGAPTLNELFNRIAEAQLSTGQLFSTIKSIIDLSQKDVSLSSTNLKIFLEEQKPILISLNKNIVIRIITSLDEEGLMVLIDKNQFKELIRNLVLNACQHGYQESNIEKNIVFEITQEDDPTKLTLNYYNDGLPFPEGFSFNDFKSFGKRYNNSSGSGLGGHLIALIMEKHQGEIVHFAETDSYPLPGENSSLKVGVHFKITIPKS
ncbi:MAG: N-6 DNA methylase [Bacteroidetes bacterium]|nr:N-6 DNA methylase [Bacteroidota bacterium]